MYKWNKYRQAAKARGFTFNLSKDQFVELISSDCHYCEFGGGGIDRKDNSIGYLFDNCLPACYTCNVLKGSFGYKEFIERCNMISQKHSA